MLHQHPARGGPPWPCPDRPRQISNESDASTARSFFRRRKRRMTTIYVDSRKRVAGDDSSFEFDIGETIHLQTGARRGGGDSSGASGD